MNALAVADPPKIGRPRKWQTVEELDTLLQAYYHDCDTRKVPYSIYGLCDALDVSRQTLLEYEGEVEGRNQGSPAFADAIKRAKRRVMQSVEEQLLSRDRQVAGHIFWLKNNAGWRDVQEVDHTHTLLAIGQPGSVPSALEPPVIDATFVSEPSLSPVAINSCAVEKPAK